jgi:carbamoyltransferase
VKVLGINTSHNASICQITDGVIDFYLEEDRFNKIKNWYPMTKLERYDYLSIKEYAKGPYDIVNIASFDRRFPQIPNSHNFDNIINENILKQIPGFGNFEYIFRVEHHHFYHAHCGFHFSNFKDAICIVMDGSGAQPYFNYKKYFSEVESVYYFNKEQQPKSLYKHLTNSKNLHHMKKIDDENIVIDGVELLFSSRPSSGQKFSGLTSFLGLGSGNEAGKTMGLASYGNLTGNRPEDLGRQLQEETKKDTIELIRKAISYNDCKNIVLSGGYALNCVNNYEYLKEFPDYNFFVDPVAHDGGTAIGAALWAYQNAK